jgi:hypothetical protein
MVHAQRIALVIGNAAYAEKPLRNQVNDATDITLELRKAGVDVKRQTDFSRPGMIDPLHWNYGATKKIVAKTGEPVTKYVNSNGWSGWGAEEVSCHFLPNGWPPYRTQNAGVLQRITCIAQSLPLLDCYECGSTISLQGAL